MSAPTQVGIIGLGIIGSRIAGVLRDQGAEVHAWNRSPKDIDGFVDSPAEVARRSSAIQLFVRNGEDVLEIVNAMKETLTGNHLVICHATISPADAREVAAIVNATGAAFLEAPFTGSKNAAADGQLVYYVSGPADALDRARPLLELSSKDLLYLGEPVGTAAVLKIATNMITATTVAILAESLTVARAEGIDPGQFAKALAGNACSSTLTGMKVPTMIEGNFEPHFSLRNMFKDAQFGLGLGSDHDIDLPVLSTVAAVMFDAMRAGHDEEDFSVVLSNYQKNSGTPAASPEPEEGVIDEPVGETEPEAPADASNEEEPPDASTAPLAVAASIPPAAAIMTESEESENESESPNPPPAVEEQAEEEPPAPEASDAEPTPDPSQEGMMDAEEQPEDESAPAASSTQETPRKGILPPPRDPDAPPKRFFGEKPVIPLAPAPARSSDPEPSDMPAKAEAAADPEAITEPISVKVPAAAAPEAETTEPIEAPSEPAPWAITEPISVKSPLPSPPEPDRPEPPAEPPSSKPAPLPAPPDAPSPEAVIVNEDVPRNSPKAAPEEEPEVDDPW